MRFKLKLFSLSIALMYFAGIACAHARHVAVVADATFARAVFAVDDAETKACQSGALSPATCALANPRIVAALQDVKALTLALQATPKNVAVPKNLPDLLADLTATQNIIGPIAGAPNAPAAAQSVGASLTAAINATIQIVRSFTGGQ